MIHYLQLLLLNVDWDSRIYFFMETSSYDVELCILSNSLLLVGQGAITSNCGLMKIFTTILYFFGTPLFPPPLNPPRQLNQAYF